MEIVLHRPSTYLLNGLGREIPMAIFFNKKRVGTLLAGQTKTIPLPESSGVLQVGMTKVEGGLEFTRISAGLHLSGCFAHSPEYPINSTDDGKCLEAGTSFWVNFDLLSLSYLPFLSRRVFYIR